MLRSLFLLILHAFLFSFSQQSDTYIFNVFTNPDSTWGYKIIHNKKTMILQTTVPSHSGDKGFLFNEDAFKVAKKVVDKLNDNQFPPTITKKELLELNLKQTLFSEDL